VAATRTDQSDRCDAPSFIPEIDGLRAFAILGVLLFHLELPWCSLGWMGVELFFVISGFLITRILLASRDKPRYFTTFYSRRTLRIFPIYYLVITLYTLEMFFSHGLVAVRTMPFYYAYLQTIPQLHSGLTDAPMLIHTWTLAIEEQFYLLWPLAVLLLSGRKFLIANVAILLVAPIVRFLTLSASSPYLIIGWLPAQMDLLGAGAIIAFASQYLSVRSLRRAAMVALAAGAAGMVIIVRHVGLETFWMTTQWSRLWYSPLLLSAMAATFAGIVALAASRHALTRWLSWRPLTHYGKISYGIYLYHPYAFLAMGQLFNKYKAAHPHMHHAWSMPILLKLGCSYAVALVSWHLIESPMKRLKERLTQWLRATPPRVVDLPIFDEPDEGLELT